MLIKNTITMTNRDDVVQAAMYSGAKIVAMQEATPNAFDSNPMIVPGTILLPPYEAVAAELDGNLQMAAELYIRHLSSKEADMYLCAIVTAAMKGIPIVIYLERDAYDLKYVGVFYEYVASVFGIFMITSEASTFNYNSAFDGVVLSKLFAYDLIDVDTFFLEYPVDQPLMSDIVLSKLVILLNPYTEDRTIEGYYKYFEDYKNSIKEVGNKMLIIPATVGGATNDNIRNF